MQPLHSPDELYGMIQDLGWSIDGVRPSPLGYSVMIRDPNGRVVERTGKTEEWALANAYNFVSRQNHPHLAANVNRGQDLIGLPEAAYGSHAGLQNIAHDYMASVGLPYNPPKTYTPVDPQRATRIAAEYDRMSHDPDNPQVAAAYRALADETMAQYNHLAKNGYNFEFYPEHDPYPIGPRQSVEDIHNNKHMYVYPTDAGFGTGADASDHPLLADSGVRWNGRPVTYNDIFRGVHDVFGHAKEGVGFRTNGEENAWRQHAAMFSPLARGALTSETRGQNSWVNFGPHGKHNQIANQANTIYADQKAGIMPEWTHHEGAEDPKLSVLYPSIQDIPGERERQPINLGPQDPNKDYVSGEQTGEPIQMGSPEDQAKLNAAHVNASAQGINTEWWKSPDPNVWKQAVMNAFKMALLSPRKHFNHNIVHAQHLRGLPHDATSADMFRSLEFNRRRWNAARGHDPLGHLRFKKELKQLTDLIQQQFPSQYNPDDAQGIALGVIGELVSDSEHALLAAAKDMPERFSPETQQWNKKKPTTLGLVSSAYDAVKAQLRIALDSRGSDQLTMIPDERPQNESAMNKLEALGLSPDIDLQGLIKKAALEYHPENKEDYQTDDPHAIGDPGKYAGKYGAFVYNHLDAVETVGKHINDITNLAHEDITKGGGKGHIFRHGLLQMNLPGINPKVASFTWLLLAPTTSELGTMDTHMARALGGSKALGTHLPKMDVDTISNPLHYYGAERALRAMKDASGYHDLPLGQFQWSLWDKLRGSESEHRGAAVLDSHMMPHSEMEWPPTTSARFTPEWEHEDWITPAMDARRRAWTQYMQEHGGGALNRPPDISNPRPHPTFDPDYPTRPGQMIASTHEEDNDLDWFNSGEEDKEDFLHRVMPRQHHQWGYWAPINYNYDEEEPEETPPTTSAVALSEDGGIALAAKWKLAGRHYVTLKLYLNEQEDALAYQPGWKQFKEAALNTFASYDWKISETQPAFRFVFYRGHLEVQPHDRAPSHRQMLEKLLKDHNHKITDYQVEDKDVASGNIHKDHTGLTIELTSLADNDAQRQALEAIQRWNDMTVAGPIQPTASWEVEWQLS